MQYMAINTSSAKPLKEDILGRFMAVGNQLGRVAPENLDFRLIELLEALEGQIAKGRAEQISKEVAVLAKRIIIREKGN
jgi:hypothetical protein